MIEGLYVEFVPPEDRLLIRVHHGGNEEMLFWFTRRLTRLLWPVLMKMAEQRPEIQAQPSPEVRRALVEIKHEEALQQVQFTRGVPPAPQQPRVRPNGDTPVLVTTVQSSRTANGFTLLSLRPDSGHAWDLTLSDNLLHGFLKLLRDQATGADWNLTLASPSGVASPIGEGPRQLH